jgi:hypothetical protein
VIISEVIQGSVEWHNIRQGKVTGSRLARAIGSKAVQKTFLAELVSERMTEPDIDGFTSKAMEWGNTWEPKAVEASAEIREIDFEVCGMMLSDEIENYAVSPDAVYYEDGEIVGGVETKCPNSDTHVGYLLDGVVPKKYKEQVYAPFLVSDKVQWWDFASFDPRNYSRPLFIVRVNRADIQKELEEAKPKLAKFLDEVKTAHQSLIF